MLPMARSSYPVSTTYCKLSSPSFFFYFPMNKHWWCALQSQLNTLKHAHKCFRYSDDLKYIILFFFSRDILLLEAGFLAIIIAPFNLQLLGRRWPVGYPHDGITLWLARWLLFRLMFASGVVKLTSHCPTWWGLSGM